mgnify:CR=1 FL=1
MTAKETRSRIQLLLGVTADGSFGPKTQTAYDELKIAGPNMEWPPKAPVSIPPGGNGTFDERTEKNLKTLHTAAQPIFRSFLSLLIPHMAAKGVVAKVISGTRTYAEQDELFSHGRTKPGPKVTNARGGQSNHNFGCAVDIGLFKDGDYLEDSPLYLEAGPIGKSVGLTWGGDWKSIKDYPHFEALQFKAPVL